jgi:phosphate starvation-inducible PhoH-like protein
MAAYAAMQIRDHHVEEIIVTRPTVEAGASKLGFLKGGMKEKFEPWLWPYLKGLDFILGPGHREYLLEKERIKAVPLQYMQGTSFDDAIVLADEFENATIAELKMLLTRIGEGTRVFIGGDIEQAQTRDSGLSEAIAILKHSVPGVAHVEYQTSDCVRSEFTRRVLEAFAGVDYQSHGVSSLMGG